mmetsp:Transcript_31909/g.70921  ORF Transcript_31909/g.70921 Transcript_31909/m.70921 type:complete len:81 (+) Transcript_31909:617-859(+)
MAPSYSVSHHHTPITGAAKTLLQNIGQRHASDTGLLKHLVERRKQRLMTRAGGRATWPPMRQRSTALVPSHKMCVKQVPG